MSRSTFVIDQEGHAWARGNNVWGQLGNNSEGQTFSPVTGLPPIKGIASGHYHTLFLDNQGRTWGCGMGQLYLFGQQSQASVITPTLIDKLRDIEQVACGTYHSLFLDNQGRTWGCGSNKWAKLGLGARTFTSPKLIKKAPLSQAVAAGDDFSLFLDKDGYAWRTSPTGITKIRGLPQVTAMDASRDKAIFLDHQGQVWANQVDHKDKTWSIPKITQLPKSIQVSCGDHHWTALDHKGQAWTWGHLKSDLMSRIPQVVKHLPKLTSVMAGSDYSVFLDETGNLWGHGDNLVSQLADDKTRITRPVPLNLVGRGNLSLMS